MAPGVGARGREGGGGGGQGLAEFLTQLPLPSSNLESTRKTHEFWEEDALTACKAGGRELRFARGLADGQLERGHRGPGRRLKALGPHIL